MPKPHLQLRAPGTDGVWQLSAGVERQLRAVLGEGGLITDNERLQAYGGDESPVMPVLPAAVVLPRSTLDVARVLDICHRERIPLTPRGGGSGKVGGCVPLYGGVVLATHTLTTPVQVDHRSRIARAGAGILLAQFQGEVEAAGLAYPPDPGSAEWATLGGTVATNAGGPSSMKYGVTTDHVLALEVVVPGGEILNLGHHSPKGVTGYNLAGLFTGSEGTLGVVTGVTLRLRTAAPVRRSLYAPFDSPSAAVNCLGELLRHGVEPRAAEFFDTFALAGLRGEVPGLPPGEAALLIELDGPSDQVCQYHLEQAAERLLPYTCADPIVARDGAQHQHLWQVRALLSKVVKRGFAHYVSEDVGVPPSQLPSLVEYVAHLRATSGLTLLCYGHAGDGNLHVNVLFNDLQQQGRVDEVVTDLFRRVITLGGTLSGEHGIGAAKRKYMPLEQSLSLMALQRALKAQWDPHGIMNPGKIF